MLMQDPRKQMNDQTVSRILICHKLNLHGPELHPPANIVIDGDLQPHRIPVSPIQHLEYRILLVAHFLKLLMHNQNIPFEDVGEMIKQIVVDLCLYFCG